MGINFFSSYKDQSNQVNNEATMSSKVFEFINSFNRTISRENSKQNTTKKTTWEPINQKEKDKGTCQHLEEKLILQIKDEVNRF